MPSDPTERIWETLGDHEQRIRLVEYDTRSLGEWRKIVMDLHRENRAWIRGIGIGIAVILIERMISLAHLLHP